MEQGGKNKAEDRNTDKAWSQEANDFNVKILNLSSFTYSKVTNAM